MSGESLASNERALIKLEAEQKSLVSSIDTLKSQQQLNQRILTDLEKGQESMRFEVRQLLDKIGRVAEDSDELAKTFEKQNEENRRETQEFVDAIISTMTDVTTNFKEAIETVVRTFTDKIVKDHEPRIRALEKKVWVAAGVVSFVIVIAGLLIDYIKH